MHLEGDVTKGYKTRRDHREFNFKLAKAGRLLPTTPLMVVSGSRISTPKHYMPPGPAAHNMPWQGQPNGYTRGSNRSQYQCECIH